MSEPEENLDISDLKDTFLECPVCVEHFNQTDRRPRLLHSCLHAFCTQCLDKLLQKEGKGQVTCPICRHVEKIRGKAGSLPADPMRSKLVDYLQMKHKQKVLCTECEKNDAVSRCQKCRSNLCKDCEYVHRNHRVSRDHIISTLDEVLKQPHKCLSKGHFCPSHPQHQLEFHCATDESLCCVSCTVLDHKGHDLQKLDEASGQKRTELESRMKQASKLAGDLREARMKGSQLEKTITDTKNKSLSDIDKIFDDMKKALDERKRHLVATVVDKSNSLLSAVQKTSAAQDQTLAIIESTDTYFTQTKEKADDVEMLQIYPAIKRTVEALHGSQEIPNLQRQIADFTFVTDNNTDMRQNIRQLGSFVKYSDVENQRQSCSDERMCTICLNLVTNPTMLKCGDVFCTPCIDAAFKVKKICPNCKTVCGPITGNMPPGDMSVCTRSTRLPGYEGYGTIVITYNFYSGKQGAEHPNPGKRYKGTTRTAYLPDSPEGRKVLKLLEVAWDRSLTFTVGRSTTIGGEEDRVTWNEIHHKTKTHGGTAKHGYPDPGYLQRVTQELAAQGVTDESIV